MISVGNNLDLKLAAVDNQVKEVVVTEAEKVKKSKKVKSVGNNLDVKKAAVTKQVEEPASKCVGKNLDGKKASEASKNVKTVIEAKSAQEEMFDNFLRIVDQPIKNKKTGKKVDGKKKLVLKELKEEPCEVMTEIQRQKRALQFQEIERERLKTSTNMQLQSKQLQALVNDCSPKKKEMAKKLKSISKNIDDKKGAITKQIVEPVIESPTKTAEKSNTLKTISKNIDTRKEEKSENKKRQANDNSVNNVSNKRSKSDTSSIKSSTKLKIKASNLLKKKRNKELRAAISIKAKEKTNMNNMGGLKSLHDDERGKEFFGKNSKSQQLVSV